MSNLKDFFIEKTTSFILSESLDGHVIIKQWDKESVGLLTEDVDNDEDVAVTEMAARSLEEAFKKIDQVTKLSENTKEAVRNLWNDATSMEMKVQIREDGGVDIVTED